GFPTAEVLCWCWRTATSGPSRRSTTRLVWRTACSLPAPTARAAPPRSSYGRTPATCPRCVGALCARPPRRPSPTPAATRAANRNCRYEDQSRRARLARRRCPFLRCERRRKLLTTPRSRDWRLWMEHHREARDDLPRAWAPP